MTSRTSRLLLVLLAALIAGVGSWVLHKATTGGSTAEQRPPSARDEPSTTGPKLRGHRVLVEGGTRGRRPLPTQQQGSIGSPTQTDRAISMSVPIKGLRSKHTGGVRMPREIRLKLVPDGREQEPILVRIQPSSEGSPAAEVELPPADWFTVESIVIDGWDSDQGIYGNDRLIPDKDGRIHLPVVLPVRTVLTVRTNGAPVPGAIVHERTPPDSVAMLAVFPSFPGLTRITREADADGRVVLPRTASGSTWWVGGPGLAWKRVEAPASTPHMDVTLAKGGKLSLEVEPCTEQERPIARLFWIPTDMPRPIEDPAALFGDARVASVPFGADCTLELDGLRLGDWLVAVSHSGVQPGDGAPWTLVSVRAGASDRIRFDAPEPKPPGAEPHAFAGRVRVPEGWDEPYFLALISDTGRGYSPETLRPSEVAGVWTFQGRSLPAGRYCVTVEPLGWSTAVNVPGPSDGVDISLPRAQKLEVHVIDRATRQRIPAARVLLAQRDWRPGTLGTVNWGQSQELGKLPGEGGYLTRVGAGPVRIQAEAEGFVETSMTISVTDTGPRSVEIALERGGRVIVRVTRAGADEDAVYGYVTLTHVSADTSWAIVVNDGAGRLDGLPPGSYRAAWDPSGSDPAEPALTERFEVHSGRATEVVFRE